MTANVDDTTLSANQMSTPPQPPMQLSSPPVCVDSLSQIQFELHRISELFLSTVGELQRDTGPVSVSGEELLCPPSGVAYKAEERAKGFAGEIMQAHANLRILIASLPSTSTSPSPPPSGGEGGGGEGGAREGGQPSSSSSLVTEDEESAQLRRIQELQKEDARLLEELRRHKQVRGGC